MYNISEIQKGIQCYHAGIEYALKYWNNEDFQQWASVDKTVILLNGGTSNHIDYDNLGSMEEYASLLETNEIKFAFFNEPDLNYSLSSIAFLADERVWDRETYLNFDFIDSNLKLSVSSHEGLEKYFDYKPIPENIEKQYLGWLEKIGGEKNVFLRNFISNLRLA
jgi:hypothetical protein